MFVHEYTVRLRDTDAAGLLYFAEQFRIAHEAFEEYLNSVGHSLAEHLVTSSYMFPIVHAEADFAAPLAVGDRLTVRMSVGRIGNTSFTLHACIDKKDGVRVGTVDVVHVTVERGTRKKMRLPDEMLDLLAGLKD